MKTYYHGTSYYCAYRIFNEGFRIVRYFGGGGVKGSGIYVTDNVDYAFDMASNKAGWEEKSPNKACFIECDLKLTNPIFWTKKEYDPSVIKYLKKEFNKKIDDWNYDVAKFIPRNKKLTRTEVINLINYWAVQRQKRGDRAAKKGGFWAWGWEKAKGDSCFLNNVRFLLSRHNFAGWGQYTHDAWDSDEIVVFNPSEVVPVKCFTGSGDWDKKEMEWHNVKIGKEIDLEELKKGYDHYAKELKEDDEKYGENLRTELYK